MYLFYNQFLISFSVPQQINLTAGVQLCNHASHISNDPIMQYYKQGIFGLLFYSGMQAKIYVEHCELLSYNYIQT